MNLASGQGRGRLKAGRSIRQNIACYSYTLCFLGLGPAMQSAKQLKLVLA
jgi:hypothetical protein